MRIILIEWLRLQLNGKTERVYRFLNSAFTAKISKNLWEEFPQLAVYAHINTQISGTHNIDPFFLSKITHTRFISFPFLTDMYAHHLVNLTKVNLTLRLHGAIYRPNSFVLMLRYCANLKAIRYQSTKLNGIGADKLHCVIVVLTMKVPILSPLGNDQELAMV